MNDEIAEMYWDAIFDDVIARLEQSEYVFENIDPDE